MDPGPVNFLNFPVDSQQRFSRGWPKSVPEHTIIYLLLFLIKSIKISEEFFPNDTKTSCWFGVSIFLKFRVSKTYTIVSIVFFYISPLPWLFFFCLFNIRAFWVLYDQGVSKPHLKYLLSCILRISITNRENHFRLTKGLHFSLVYSAFAPSFSSKICN